MGQLEDHLEDQRVGVSSMANLQTRQLHRRQTQTLTMTYTQNEVRVRHEVVNKKKNGNILKTYGQGVNIDDQEVQRHGKGHGRKQPEVAPWGHTDQRLVL